MTFILQTRVESEFDQTQKMTGEGPMEKSIFLHKNKYQKYFFFVEVLEGVWLKQLLLDKPDVFPQFWIYFYVFVVYV